MSELETFRAETRAWLEEMPASMRTPMPEREMPWGGRNASYPNPDTKSGWTIWPHAAGRHRHGRPNMAVAGCPRKKTNFAGRACPHQSSAGTDKFGLWMLGPALLNLPAKSKEKYIGEIVRGEIRWCQGYSEPGAGSDLAGLQTKAEDKGDHYLVNGQKVWTSYADQCDWIFCLVRTDNSVKHDGISFLLIDMDDPGVEARPIKLISGSSPFCETFLTDVKVPKENLVGELNKGWTIAKRLLEHERSMISAWAWAPVQPPWAAWKPLPRKTSALTATALPTRPFAAPLPHIKWISRLLV